jgi:pilus assembly protein CpaB
VRLRTVIVFILAVLFGGGVAVFTARAWLEGQRNLILSARPTAAQTDTIVVAARPLRFGDKIENEYLREIPWPTGRLPKGAFHKRGDLLKAGERYVTSAIEVDEPIFGWKITGPGQRATLSAALSEGMKAITIRVNDVLGVAGFVLPGDRVDVLLMRGDQSVDVLLQGVKVLAIDQTADDRRDQPVVVKAVTFEVSTEEAQKLTLAASIGQLSLALRNVASAKFEQTKRVTLSDLVGGVVAKAALEDNADTTAEPLPAPTVAKLPAPSGVTVGVSRNFQRSEYRVRAPN